MSTENVQNILKVYAMAIDSDVESGLNWYDLALADCTRLAVKYHASVEAVVYATAALSPNLKWEWNIEGTENLLNGLLSVPGAYGANIRKAYAILTTGELSHLKGNKVTHFAKNILGDRVGVTADTWAWRIWAGVDFFVKPPSLEKLYSEIEADYQAAAAVVGIDPRQLQAITWVTFRRLSKAPAGQLAFNI